MDGELVIDILFKPVRPVEYVTISFTVTHANGDPLTAEELEDLKKAFDEAIDELYGDGE